MFKISFSRNNKAAAVTEYALLAGLVGTLAITSVSVIAERAGWTSTTLAESLEPVTGADGVTGGQSPAPETDETETVGSGGGSSNPDDTTEQPPALFEQDFMVVRTYETAPDGAWHAFKTIPVGFPGFESLSPLSSVPLSLFETAPLYAFSFADARRTGGIFPDIDVVSGWPSGTFNPTNDDVCGRLLQFTYNNLLPETLQNFFFDEQATFEMSNAQSVLQIPDVVNFDGAVVSPNEAGPAGFGEWPQMRFVDSNLIAHSPVFVDPFDSGSTTRAKILLDDGTSWPMLSSFTCRITE